VGEMGGIFIIKHIDKLFKKIFIPNVSYTVRDYGSKSNDRKNGSE
jgi:hypothetical protein